MNPAPDDREFEATVALPTLPPADLNATQIPEAPGSVQEVVRPAEAAVDSSATVIPADEPGLQPQGMVGVPSASGFRFQVLRPHARGGLGQVSVAEDLELHREVALKEILQRHAGNVESQARFIMEAEITGGLEHPGIVPVYGLGTYPDGRPFYAMRFIRGEPLADTIERFHETADQRDPGKNAVQLRQLIGRFIDVCNAIEYAHSRGILHRDIKPANIMLGKYGETLVVDWGIAKLMNQPESAPVVEEGTLRPVSAGDTTATQMGSTVGTPQYMSPEQAAGRLDLMGPTSDVYSLGATLYYLLTGVAAFDGNRLLELLRKVERGDFVPPRELNKSIARPLEAICLKAMALEPEDRYASARALSDDLEHWLADEPVVAYRESAMERFMRWLRHHRSWAQASLITLLAVTAVSIVAALLVNQARRREVAAREESERQRALADESFRHARYAVDDFFTRVSESTLLDVPGMQPLRRDLLQVALSYEQKFLQQRGNDPTLRRDAAAAMFRVALVTAEIKSKAEGLPLFERALKIQDQLLTENPKDATLRYALSNTYNEIGRAHYVAGRLNDAETGFRKSLELRERLVKDDPNNTEYQRKLANTYNNVGVLAKQGGRWDDALADYSRANEIRQRLVALDPQQPLFRRDLARGYYNLGVLARPLDYEKAVASLRHAAQVYDKLMTEFPLVTEYRQELGVCYRVLGDLLLTAMDYDAALEALDQARDIQQRLANENPHLFELAADLAGTYSSLAGLQEHRGNTQESLDLAQQAVDVLTRLVETNPEATRFRTDLAANLVRIGTLQLTADDETTARDTLARARDIYAELIDLEPQNPALHAGQGKCLINLGFVQTRLEAPAEARQALEEAWQIYEELLKAFPDQSAYRDDLARCYVNLGLLEQTSNNFEAALGWFQRVRKIHEDAASGAAAANHRRQLAVTLLLIAEVHVKDDAPDEAMTLYEQAQAIVQALIDENGATGDLWSLLASAVHGRGSVQLAREQRAQALATYREAVDYQKRAFDLSPETQSWRQSLNDYYADVAMVQVEIGQTDQAVVTTLKRKVLWPNQPLELYRVARDLAALIPASSEDLSDTQRQERDRHLQQVVGLLTEARRAGYKDWQAAEKDSAFAALREMAAFQKLLTDDP